MSHKADEHLGKQMNSIYEKDQRIYFPRYYWNEYFEDSTLSDKDITCRKEDKGLCSIPSNCTTVEELYQIRKECYSAQVWYEALSAYTFKSRLIEWDGSMATLRSILSKETSWPLFIKLDSMSAKDIRQSCVFQNVDEVVKVFSQSQRIKECVDQPRIEYPLHLFIREVNQACLSENHVEIRCFIHRSKLTAFGAYFPCYLEQYIFNPTEKKQIIDYIQSNIIPKLPYSDATVDLVQNSEGQLTLIEVNNFGIDSIAGADPFSWDQDYAYLYGYLGDDFIYTLE